MKLQILNAAGTVVLEWDIPNKDFQGLAKGELWEITTTYNNTQGSYYARMRISIDGQHETNNTLSQRQSHGNTNPSPSPQTKEKRQETA